MKPTSRFHIGMLVMVLFFVTSHAKRSAVADESIHWSLMPVRSPSPPPVMNDSWSNTVIDPFILARLHEEGLRPASEADRTSWLRRVYLDLIGLPPTPEQVSAFVRDHRVDAHERVVTRLLHSPRYGERWAQHWLDVVRYADTHGFEVNTERPHAWPYRDYVIDAFNQDRPYNQFIREQLAGDALGEDAATGFLVTASVLLPGQIGKDEPSKRLARQDALDEIVVNVSQTFLGLSVGCARCHDHMFDPITQADYFAMQAFVAGVEYADRPIRTPDDVAEVNRRRAGEAKNRIAQIDQQLLDYVPLARVGVNDSNDDDDMAPKFPEPPPRPAVNARMNVDRFSPIVTTRVRFVITATNSLEPCLDELEVFDIDGNNVALASEGTTARSSGDTVVPNRHERRFVNDGEYGNSRSWMSNQTGAGWIELQFHTEQTIDRIIWGRDRQGKFTDRLATGYQIDVFDESGNWRTVADSGDRSPFVPNQNDPTPVSTAGLGTKEAEHVRRLLDEKRRLEKQITEATRGQLAFAGTFRRPDEIRLLRRGDPEQPQEVIAPAVLSAIGSRSLPVDAPDRQRRQTLADWIANPDNPLTARVMVNRIWQGHFGVGLVDTPNDFGRNGTQPTHPELLDWLAAEFVRSGWSVKQMHQQIVLSATYRQAGQHDPDAAIKDADVRLLWRSPRRRLEGEAIRDSMLLLSGELNPKMGGSGFNLFDKRGGLTGFKPIESYTGDGLRRMIYAHKVRRERDAIFGAFDCPDGGQSAANRRESTTPIQALNLFNSRFAIDRSRALATRIQTSASDPAEQIRQAYLLVLCREPNHSELVDVVPIVSQHGLETLCRALFNSNEFLFMP